jgi:hypothetical protein
MDPKFYYHVLKSLGPYIELDHKIHFNIILVRFACLLRVTRIKIFSGSIFS